jgi:imidazolonepropionase-like amidohydrolase
MVGTHVYECMNRFRKCLLIFLLAMSLYPTPVLAADHETVACVGGRVYPSPTDAPIDDAVVLIDDGKIGAVAARGNIKYDLPASARVLDCAGKFIVAGYWNSHVHFETGWADAANAPAAKLAAHMQEMLTGWGFTTVWDLGSDPANTLAIRRRVESGEVPGARILMAGDIFPKNGHPIYLPAEMQLLEAASPAEAAQDSIDYLKQGLDGIKLFTGAYMGNAKPVVNMDTAIVKAAVDVAHAQGRPVFTHPQNRAGVDNALAGGVDVLAHTIPTEGQYTSDELAQVRRQHVALIPTLALWPIVMQGAPQAAVDKMLHAGEDELKQYFSAGGTILFGTDVGFQSEYDPTHELEYMGWVLSWHDILASLTTNPSEFFKARTKGRVEKGMDADLVVLDRDPAMDVRNFAKVAYTIRAGKVIYSAAKGLQ